MTSGRGVSGWLSRGFAATLLTIGASAGAVTIAVPASAATTINCDTAAHTSTAWTAGCLKLTGTAKCVWNNGDGTWTMAMGFLNPTADTLFASIPNTGTNTGAYNAFTATGGSAANPGHFATFPPGTYTSAFTVTWKPSSSTDPVSWQLMGATSTWTRTITACPSKPVPVIGNGIAGGMGVIALTGLGLLNRRRFRGLLSSTRLVGVTAA